MAPIKTYCAYTHPTKVFAHFKDWFFISSRRVGLHVLSIADEYYVSEITIFFNTNRSPTPKTSITEKVCAHLTRVLCKIKNAVLYPGHLDPGSAGEMPRL